MYTYYRYLLHFNILASQGSNSELMIVNFFNYFFFSDSCSILNKNDEIVGCLVLIKYTF